jgi:hypothetical protein
VVIDDNYLMLLNTNEFNIRLANYFYRRLQLFLCIPDRKAPKIIFTNSRKKLAKYFDDPANNVMPRAKDRAFYDEETDGGVIGINANSYRLHGPDFLLEKESINHLIEKYSFKYIIPLSDIYHEMIHHIQYVNTDSYEFTDFLESTDDMYTYCITGHWNMDYLTESIGFWRVCIEILQVNDIEFYIMLRNAIVDPDFSNSLLKNRNFIKLLAKSYNGDINQFLHNFKKDFGNKEYEDEFYKYMSKIHDLIFYKY